MSLSDNDDAIDRVQQVLTSGRLRELTAVDLRAVITEVYRLRGDNTLLRQKLKLAYSDDGGA